MSSNTLKGILRNLGGALRHFKDYQKRAMFSVFLDLVCRLFESMGLLLIIPVIALMAPAMMPESKLQKAVLSVFRTLNINMTLVSLSAGILIFFTIKLLFLYRARIYIMKLANVYRKDLITNIFTSYQESDWNYFNAQKRGYLINYILMVTTENSYLFYVIIRGISGLLSVGLYYIFALFLSPGITLSITVLLAILVIFYSLVFKKIHYHSFKELHSTNRLAKLVEQFLSGFENIRVYSAGNSAIDKICNEAQIRMDHNITQKRYQLGFKASIELLLVIVMLVIIIFALQYRHYPIEKIIVGSMFMGRLMMKLSDVYFFNRLAEKVPGLQLFDRVYADFRKHRDIMLNSGIIIPDIKRSIEFRGVDITFSRQISGTEKLVLLHDLNFSIQKGAICCIEGESGTGKTTIICMLAGLIKPAKGEIFIDDTALSGANITEWSRNIGYVSQHSFITNDTVYSNISFFRDLSQDDIIMAAKMANCHNMISNLKNGYDTILGEAGTNLSGGQKQMICLARALAGNPKLLLLDEAASSIDTQSESTIISTINEMRGKITIVNVAHRSSAALQADITVTIKDGTITQKA